MISWRSSKGPETGWCMAPKFVSPPFSFLLIYLTARRSLKRAGFPHALVMTFLFSNKPYVYPATHFGSGSITDELYSLSSKIRGIFSATRTHATNLAKFVTLYKVLLLIQKRMNGGKERDLDSLIAGGLGGWWVFGERTAVSRSTFPHLSLPLVRNKILTPGRSTSKSFYTSYHEHSSRFSLVCILPPQLLLLCRSRLYRILCRLLHQEKPIPAPSPWRHYHSRSSQRQVGQESCTCLDIEERGYKRAWATV